MADYYYADPTGNITVLAALPAGAASLPELAEGYMRLEPDAEQVGFLSGGSDGADISLTMAGGEFCGNATLSAAAVYCMQNGFITGERTVLVGASGAEAPVPVQVTALSDACFEGTVSMPCPTGIEPIQLFYDGIPYSFVKVEFPGITHLVFCGRMEKSAAESAAPVWCKALNADALGILFLDEQTDTLTPLVYVESAGTLFWESSCASGTTAAGACLRWKNNGASVTKAFREPAGTLKIHADSDGQLFLTGRVAITHKHF